MNACSHLLPVAFAIVFSTRAQSFIINGGFEDPVISPPHYTTTVPGWDLAGLEARFGTALHAQLPPSEGDQDAAFNPPGQIFANQTGVPDPARHITQYVLLAAGAFDFRFDMGSDSPTNSVVNYELRIVDDLTHAPIGGSLLEGSGLATITGDPMNPFQQWTHDVGGSFILPDHAIVQVRLFVNGSVLDNIRLAAVPEMEGTALAASAGLLAFAGIYRSRNRL